MRTHRPQHSSRSLISGQEPCQQRSRSSSQGQQRASRGPRRSAVAVGRGVAASAAVQVLRRMRMPASSARCAAKVRAERKGGAQPQRDDVLNQLSW